MLSFTSSTHARIVVIRCKAQGVQFLCIAPIFLNDVAIFSCCAPLHCQCQCQTKKKVIGRTRKHVKNPINLTLRSKFKVVSGSWMYMTHRLMVIHPCAKYGRLMSNQKKVMGRTRKHVKNPINLTLRSNFKVVSGSWMYATHRLMVIYPCAKYGKPMSNHKKVMGRTRICTDRRTDGQTEWFLYTPLNFVRGGYNYIAGYHIRIYSKLINLS